MYFENVIFLIVFCRYELKPWEIIGCVAKNDSILSLPEDNKTVVHVIHSSTSSTSSTKKRRNNKSKRMSSDESFDITLNNKQLIHDLRCTFPLSKIREQNYRKKRKILVIGAGISGLTCARELMAYGYNVQILEVLLKQCCTHAHSTHIIHILLSFYLNIFACEN